MPMIRSHYPDDWEAISKRIRFERADGKCEWCAAAHMQPHPVTGSTVILTTAHLGVDLPNGMPGDKHNKMDVRDENLASLCQRCHLNFDRNDHIQRARATRDLRRGQLVLAAVIALGMD